MGHELYRRADFLSVQIYIYTKVTLPNLRLAKMAVKFVLIKSCVLVVLMTNQPCLPVIHKENTDHRSYYFSSDQSNHATATCLSSRSVSLQPRNTSECRVICPKTIIGSRAFSTKEDWCGTILQSKRADGSTVSASTGTLDH